MYVSKFQLGRNCILNALELLLSCLFSKSSSYISRFYVFFASIIKHFSLKASCETTTGFLPFFTKKKKVIYARMGKPFFFHMPEIVRMEDLKNILFSKSRKESLLVLNTASMYHTIYILISFSSK